MQTTAASGEGEDGEEGTSAAAAAPEENGTAQPPVRDPNSVMTCLKRALKIAHAAQQQLAVAMKTKDTTPVLLFVEILNNYIYYFEQGLPTITPSVLQVRLLTCPSGVSKFEVDADALRSSDSLSLLLLAVFLRSAPKEAIYIMFKPRR